MDKREEAEDADGHLQEGAQGGAEERVTAPVSTVPEEKVQTPRTARAEERGRAAERAEGEEPPRTHPRKSAPPSNCPVQRPGVWPHPMGPGRTRDLGGGSQAAHP